MAALVGAATDSSWTTRQLLPRRSGSSPTTEIGSHRQRSAAPWSARNFLDAWPGIDSLMRGRVIRLSLDPTSAQSSASYTDPQPQQPRGKASNSSAERDGKRPMRTPNRSAPS